MEEIILIDKPLNWTSFDVVAKVRSTVKFLTNQKVKVGHAGTLDPLATGLMIVLLGKATKQQDKFMKLDKVYEVQLILGQTSTTADDEGDKTIISEKQPSTIQLKKAINSFVGEISQIPPVYSAIKINGQRAYKLARAGKEVKIEPRKVKIYSIDEINYKYPHVSFTARVSSGTYIRSLVSDIGDKLAVGAYLSKLRRTQIGKYDIHSSISIKDIEKYFKSNLTQQ